MPVQDAVPATGRRLPFVLLGVLALLLGAGMLAGHLHRQTTPRVPVATPAPARITFRGTVAAAPSPGCQAGPGEVRAGAAVRVLDVTGAVLATTELGPGTAGGGGCEWSYRITVPATSQYQVQVASLPPDTVTRSDLARAGWTYRQTDVVMSPALRNIQSGG